MCVDRQIALFCHFRVCVRFAQFVTKMLRTKRATHVTSPPNVVTGPANKSSTRRHANDSRGAGYLEHLIAFWGALANQNISSIQLRVSNKRKNTVHRGFVACRRTALFERFRCGWLKWPPFITHTKKNPDTWWKRKQLSDRERVEGSILPPQLGCMWIGDNFPARFHGRSKLVQMAISC